MFDIIEPSTIQPTLAFIGAAIGAIGGLIGGKMTSDANAKEASKGRDFTKEQLQNRHQWEVDDLRKAGLNPILSANSAPSIGSSPTAQSADYSSAMSGAAKAGTEAVLAKQTVQNLKETNTNIQEDTNLKKAQQKAALAGADNAFASADYTRTQDTKAEALEPFYKLGGDAAKMVSSSARDLAKPRPKRPPTAEQKAYGQDLKKRNPELYKYYRHK